MKAQLFRFEFCSSSLAEAQEIHSRLFSSFAAFEAQLSRWSRGGTDLFVTQAQSVANAKARSSEYTVTSRASSLAQEAYIDEGSKTIFVESNTWAADRR